jgi:hypothetical protein
MLNYPDLPLLFHKHEGEYKGIISYHYAFRPCLRVSSGGNSIVHYIENSIVDGQFEKEPTTYISIRNVEAEIR